MKLLLSFVIMFCLWGGVPSSFKRAMTLRYATPNLSPKGVRHDGYYLKAEKNNRVYGYGKNSYKPDTLYWGCIFYNDNSYCEFSIEDIYNLNDLNIEYWGVYTVEGSLVRAQFMDPSTNGGGVSERIYHLLKNGLTASMWIQYKSKGFGRHERKETFYETPEEYHFVSSPNLPPSDSWLKKEKWMYEPVR
ncbi:MAG: hypothetical protein EOP52_06055 [Sphingobacteriales bacterium]|nr:MAG: hypothetical protein EOP52_06055 [Sphingobacteriales bacterium]